MKQIFDVAQGKRVSEIQHHRQTDDIRRRVEVSEEVRRAQGEAISPVVATTSLLPGRLAGGLSMKSEIWPAAVFPDLAARTA